jgi:hypothetical protein
VQFAERLAAREFRALLVGHRQMRQILGKSLWLYLRITHRQATDSSRSRSGLLQSVPIPVWLGPRSQRQAAWRLYWPCPWHLRPAWRRPVLASALPWRPCPLSLVAWRRPCRPWRRTKWTLESRTWPGRQLRWLNQCSTHLGGFARVLDLHAQGQAPALGFRVVAHAVFHQLGVVANADLAANVSVSAGNAARDGPSKSTR